MPAGAYFVAQSSRIWYSRRLRSDFRRPSQHCRQCPLRSPGSVLPALVKSQAPNPAPPGRPLGARSDPPSTQHLSPTVQTRADTALLFRRPRGAARVGPRVRQMHPRPAAACRTVTTEWRGPRTATHWRLEGSTAPVGLRCRAPQQGADADGSLAKPYFVSAALRSAVTENSPTGSPSPTPRLTT